MGRGRRIDVLSVWPQQVRMNAHTLYMDRSAIGYTAVPYVVGGTGWVFKADVGAWF